MTPLVMKNICRRDNTFESRIRDIGWRKGKILRGAQQIPFYYSKSTVVETTKQTNI